MLHTCSMMFHLFHDSGRDQTKGQTHMHQLLLERGGGEEQEGQKGGGGSYYSKLLLLFFFCQRLPEEEEECHDANHHFWHC